MRIPDGYISILHPDSKGTEVRVEQKELVMCKHCKHRPNGYEEEDTIRYPLFPDDVCPCRCDGDEWYSWIPSDNWFCPRGERMDGKDGDGNG